MRDVTIPRIISEKPRCNIHSKNVIAVESNRRQTKKRRVEFRLDLYA